MDFSSNGKEEISLISVTSWQRGNSGSDSVRINGSYLEVLLAMEVARVEFGPVGVLPE